METNCTVAPGQVDVPHGRGGPRTVGDGADDAAGVANLIASAVGTFPAFCSATGAGVHSV
ncbi:MAG TPA: hypothetical protein VIP05_31225 [Burkholderiaceae bacterium]